MNSALSNMLLLAQASEEAASSAAPAASHGLPGWAMALIALAVIVLPFVIGHLLERMLRIRDVGFRIGLVLFVVFLSLAPFVSRMASGGSWKDAIRLGIDLAGGTNMVFQVDREGAQAAEKDINSELMDRMVGAIIRRINPSGTEEVTVRRVGQDRIEVIVPGADQEKVDQIKRQITDLGELEFAILANEKDHANLIAMADEQGGDLIHDSKGRLVAAWKRVGFKTPETPGGEPEMKDVGTNDLVRWRDVETKDGKTVREFLVVIDPSPDKRITGRLLKRAYQTTTENGPAVGFTFNTRGGTLFQQLTTRYQPRTGAGYRTRLAVLLNNEIHSAPTINAIIGASGVIEGQFSQKELDELINVLNAGALEVPLVRQPISEFTVSPLLGIDVQEKGIRAIVVSAMAVFVFMLAYYWVAGAIADVCLLLNLIMVMGVMSFIDATFTLPGLAGLVLTIGMAVDTNVLIFERMREEQARGSSLRMSIHNGFSRALSAIIDANVTTLITAVILYMIGSDQVKGFAVTLFIGLVTSMFSALYLGRLLFDILERKRWITQLKMGSMVGVTNFDFLGKAKWALTGSVLVIAFGLGTFFVRGQDNLDIDFLGGSMVTFRFENQPTVDEVRDALQKEFEDSITLEQLKVTRPDGELETLFRLRTVEQDPTKLAEKINNAFRDSGYELVRQQVQIGEIKSLAASSPPEESAEDDETNATTPAAFAGGKEVLLTFSEPINALTAAGTLADALATVTNEDGSPKFEQPSALIRVINTEDPASPTLKGHEFRLEASPVITETDLTQGLETLKSQLSAAPNFEEINNFESSVAVETQLDAMLAMFLSVIAMVAYLWFRFQRVDFGLAVAAALVHDVLFVLGFVAVGAYLSGNTIGDFLALEDFKINMTMIAAFMTIIGYSLNDTIVVFDRIREIRGKNPTITKDMINLSLNQTLARTILTSLTVFIVVVILYSMGGEGIHGFAYCLLIGTIVGVYSTMYIAAPALLWMMKRKPALR